MSGTNVIDQNPTGPGGRNLAPDPQLTRPSAISAAVPSHAMDPGQLRTHAVLVGLRHEVEQAARAHGGEAVAEQAGEVAVRACLPAFEHALRVEATFMRTGTAWQRSGASIASFANRAIFVALRCYAADGTDDERDMRAGAALFDAAGPHVEFMPAERIGLAAGIAAGARFIVEQVSADDLRAALQKNGAQAKAALALAMTTGAAR
jgi:hypothetical protein